MRHAIRFILWTAALAAAAGAACAATGISIERSGLGLKPAGVPMSWFGSVAARNEISDAWHAADGGEVVYRGVRQAARFGLRTPESYGGIYYPLSETAGVTFEMGVIQASPLAPRRYSLLGQLQTEFAGGSSLSIGLKYRVYEADIGIRHGMQGDVTPANSYALVAARPPGMALSPTYQLQINYQYSAATIFGFVLGRELETFTPGFDQPGGPRQLTFTGQHWLTPSWALSYDVLSNDPNSFRLQGLRFGVRYRF